MESARTRTSGVDIQDPIALKLSGLMGMPANDDMESSGRWIQVQTTQVVENVEEHLSCLSNSSLWQSVSPFSRVHVSAYGNDWCDLPKGREDFRLAHIAGVEYQLRTTKRLDRFRPQQAVRVRDQAYLRRRSRHGQILTPGRFVSKSREVKRPSLI